MQWDIENVLQLVYLTREQITLYRSLETLTTMADNR